VTTETAREEQQRRAAKNQSLFREVNERERENNNNNGLWLAFVCECTYETCVQEIELTPEEYEQVRENPTHFAVAASDEHVVPDVERVVERHERYWIVEKVGVAAAVAEKLDPRSRGDEL
jgi:hypothetical protein